MAKHNYFFFMGLAGILGAIACTSAADDDEEAATGTGGSGNPYVGSGGANPNTTTPATTARGGTSATTTPSSGGTTTTTTSGLTNPNRTLTPTEVDNIEASACNAWVIEPEASPSKLELVIDVSSSMNSAAPGTNRSKWEVTREALIEAVPGLATGGGLPSNTAVGLMFYPNMINDTIAKEPADPNVWDPTVCINTSGETPMAILGTNEGDTHRNLLRQRLTEVVLGRGTPTHDAYDYVLYNTVLSPQQMAIEGDAYMLLITDGMPTLYKNCYNPAGRLSNLEGDAVVGAVDNAYNLGVKTFIVGSPGSEEGRDWLSMAAFMGGTAAGGCNPSSASGPYCHMDMTTAPDFSLALRNGLAQVMSQVAGCKFDIPTTSADGTMAVDLEKIAPMIEFSSGKTLLVGRDTTSGSSCDHGFRILSSTQMELCKATCAEMLGDSLATLRFIFGCSTEDITGGII
jgi:hypothetical protein